MGLRLNKVSDERMHEVIPSIEQMIETSRRWLAEDRPREAAKLIRCHEGLAHNLCNLGGAYYQQERPKRDVLVSLRAAADHISGYFQLLAAPTEREMRQCYLFEKLLNLVICFGTRDMREKAAAIPERVYHFVEGSHYRESYAPAPPQRGVIEYLELLKKIAAGGPWDEEAFQRAKQFCLDEKATKWERIVTLPKLEAVRAADHRVADIWNQNIAEIVKQHKHEATRGDWKHSDEAFLCLPGLALARLGMERGLTCTVDSPYLPLQLLRESA